jgi:hypothetical protein
MIGRRAVATLVLAGLGLGAVASVHAVNAPALGPTGVGSVRFGLPKAQAVAELTALFGPPTARGANTGCGPRYAEVEWGDLVAEFRSGTFSGFRYATGGYPLTTPGSPRRPSPAKAPFPKLATSARISLASTLARLRAADPLLRRVGAGVWRSANGLLFVDDAKRDPEPASSRIVEIKIGTCGAF